MAIYYDPKVINAILNPFIRNEVGIGQSYNTPTGPYSWAVTLFPGSQPSANNFIANWSATYYPSRLIHWYNVSWNNYNPTVVTQTNDYVLYTSPAVVSAINTGTAAWGALWSFNPSSLSSTFPSPQYFLLGPVTLIGSNGLFRLTDLNLVSGSSYTLNDGGFTIAMPPIA